MALGLAAGRGPAPWWGPAVVGSATGWGAVPDWGTMLLRHPAAFSVVATYGLVTGLVLIHGVMGPISSAVATACSTLVVVGGGGAGVNPLCKLPCGWG